MKFEKPYDVIAQQKIKNARETAPIPQAKEHFFKHETSITAQFIKEKMTLEQFKMALRQLGTTQGIAKFDTLSEFIAGIRQLKISKELQDHILDHENAHALESLNRGYTPSYEIHFTQKQKRYFILLVNIWKPVAASVHIDRFKKDGRTNTESELREDLIAMLGAPENLTDGEMSELDKLALGIPIESSEH